MNVKNFFSLVKFGHTVFALPFAIFGFALSLHDISFSFEISKLILILICMITARNAAMTFNRIVDKKYDAENPRTQFREIPAGIISSRQAKIFLIINIIIFVLTTSFINGLCFALSPIALAIILGYSYTKRFTFLCHFILGLGLSIAPIGTYLAVTGEMNWNLILLSFGILLWVASFDILYSLQDESFDKSKKLFSIPTVFGSKFSVLLAVILLVCSLLFFILFGEVYERHIVYLVGVGLFFILSFSQFFIFSLKNREKINHLFFYFNGLGSILFCTLAILDIYFFNTTS